MNVFKNLLALANITAYLDVYCAYHVEMIVKSVFTVISKPYIKYLKFCAEKFFQNFRFKRGNQYYKFDVWDNREEPTFFKILGEPKLYALCSKMAARILQFS